MNLYEMLSLTGSGTVLVDLVLEDVEEKFDVTLHHSVRRARLHRLHHVLDLGRVEEM